VTPTQADDAVSQMVLAVQSFINPSPKPRDWIHAIVLTSQIVKSRKEDLIELLNSGVLGKQTKSMLV
jgi:hypothetical protein